MRRPLLYVLNADNEPEPERDRLAWGLSIDDQRRVVQRDQVGEIVVSTVFTGIDYAFFGGDPVLWETMLFDADGKPLGQLRYTSRAEALVGHAEFVARLSGCAGPSEAGR